RSRWRRCCCSTRWKTARRTTFWPSPGLAWPPPPTGSCRAPGRSAWWRWCGLPWPGSVGGAGCTERPALPWPRRLRPDAHGGRDGPHRDGATYDSIGRRVDHRHVVADTIGDVGTVDGGVYSYALWLAPHRNGAAHDGIGQRVDHRHRVAGSVGNVGA